MYQSQLVFIAEWNELVMLRQSSGREAVELRHNENHEAVRAIQLGAVDWREADSQAEIEALGEARQTAITRRTASHRMLDRLKAAEVVWKLDPVAISAAERQHFRTLDWDVPLFRPDMADFDGLVERLRTWKMCADIMESKDTHAEGLLVLRMQITEFEAIRKDRVERASNRLAESSEGLDEDDIGRPSSPLWRRYITNLENSISHTHPLAFELSVMRLFVEYFVDAKQLYPEDWNFLISISPHSATWMTGSRRNATTGYPLPDEEAATLLAAGPSEETPVETPVDGVSKPDEAKRPRGAPSLTPENILAVFEALLAFTADETNRRLPFKSRRPSLCNFLREHIKDRHLGLDGTRDRILACIKYAREELAIPFPENRLTNTRVYFDNRKLIQGALAALQKKVDEKKANSP